MNEFTKEELNFLDVIMKKYHHADLTTYSQVYRKIQSMIDNYCEHASTSGARITIDGVSLLNCNKCKSMFVRIENDNQ